MREGTRFAGDYEVRFGSARINESYNGIFDFDVARFALPFDSAKTDVRGIEFVPAAPRDSMGFRLEGSSRGAAGKLWAGKEYIDDGYDIIVEAGLSGASDIGADISKSRIRSYRDKFNLSQDFQYSTNAAKYGYYANAALIGESSSAQVTLARYGVSGEIQFMLDSGANYANRSLEQRQTTLGLFRLAGPEDGDFKWDFSAYWASIYSNMTSQPPAGYFGIAPLEPAKSDEKRYGGTLNAEKKFKYKYDYDWWLGGKLEYESGKYYAETDTSFFDYPNVERISGSLYAYFFDRDLYVNMGPDYYLFSSPQKKEKIKFDGAHFQLNIKNWWTKYLFGEGSLYVLTLPPKIKDVITIVSPKYKNAFLQIKSNLNFVYLFSNELSLETGIENCVYKDTTRRINDDDSKVINDTYNFDIGFRCKLEENTSVSVRYEYFNTKKAPFALEREFHSLLLEAKMKAFSEKLDLTGQFRRVQFKDPINLLGAEATLNIEPARFFARFDNILNESYEISPGFPASGISFVVGVRYDAGMF